MKCIRAMSVGAVLGLAGLAGAEPVSETLRVTHLGTVSEMGRMSVNAATGEIAFGRTGPGAASAQRVRVMSADGSVREIGSAIEDPDAVTWDLDGVFGPAGSVIVGSQTGLYSVSPLGSVSMIAGASAELVNPEDVVMGADGGLYFADYNTGRVQRLSAHGSFSTMAQANGAVTRVALDAQGNVSAVDGSGSLLSSTIESTGGLVLSELVMGDSSALWGESAYGVDAASGTVVRLGADGSHEVLVSGLFDGADTGLSGWSDAHLDFLPTGEMVLAVAATGDVYTLVPAPGAVVIAGLGGILAVRRKR